MEGTRNKPRCRPGLRRPIDVRRPSKEVGNRAGAADAAIVLVRLANHRQDADGRGLL